MSPRWLPLGPVCATDAQLASIESVGRGVVAGRVTAIALSPDGGIIYAGAAGGGVWKSTDDGATWTPTMDAEPTLAVGAIAVAESDGTVYVGTGEDDDTRHAGAYAGVGILFSINQGGIWTLFPPQASTPAANDLVRERIQRIVVHPTRPKEVYAATTKGLLITTDRVDFRIFTPAGAARPVCSDVAVDFTDPDRPLIYAAFPEAGVFIFTGDPLNVAQGLIFRYPFPAAPIPQARFPGLNPPAPRRIALAIARSQPRTLYAAFTDENNLKGIFRTDDGGGSWRDAGTREINSRSMASFTSLLAIDPRDPQHVFFGDVRLFRRTASSSWHVVSNRGGIRDSYQGMHDDQHALAFHPTQPKVVWEGNDGGVWKSTDGGEHFFARNRGLANMQFYALDHHPAEPAVLLGGTQDDGGLSYRGYPAWRQVHGGDGIQAIIEPTSPRHWFVSSLPVKPPGLVRLTEADSNISNHKVLSKGLGTSKGLVPVVADPNRHGTLYAGMGTLFRSTNDGDSWSEIAESQDLLANQAISAIEVAPSDSSVVYFGRASGEIYRMQVGAAGGFTVVKGFPSLVDRCADIAVDPANPNVFFAVDGGPHGPDAADTTVTHRIRRGEFDPVANSLPLTLHPDLPDEVIGGVKVSQELNHVNTVVLDPDNAGVMFVGTDRGVYRGAPDPTAGGNFVWNRFSDGLPAAALVTDLKLHRPTRRLRAATMGRGIWEIALDAPDAPDAPKVDLYLRDTLLDYGLATAAAPTVEARLDPLSLRPLKWNDGADLRVDTETRFIGGFADPPSSVRYDGVDIDFLGFEALGNDSPRSRARSRVFVQVHNRGPDPAKNVDVRLFVGKKTGNTAAGSGGYPELPANFWADVFIGAFTGAGVPFRPAGPAQRIASVLPATPHIARFEIEASGANDTVGLLAVVGSADDPVPAALPLGVEAAVRSDKHLALRETTIDHAAFVTAIGVLVALGVATAVVVAAVIVVKKET